VQKAGLIRYRRAASPLWTDRDWSSEVECYAVVKAEYDGYATGQVTQRAQDSAAASYRDCVRTGCPGAGEVIERQPQPGRPRRCGIPEPVVAQTDQRGVNGV